MIEIPDTVSRIDVVSASGRGASEFWADQWEAVLQDDGRTLKLFAKGRGVQAREERDRALAEDFARTLGEIP